MKIVNKKILPKYFFDVITRKKNFELRKDDDNIQIGDMLKLNEWTGEGYTGRAIIFKVRYVLRDVPEYGLKDGYCIIGW